MSERERLRRLDRAFAPPPPELSIAVEDAFERGEKAVKLRHKIMTAASVAAALAVLFAALALAAGQALKPRVDRVVASPVGGGAGEAGPTATMELDDGETASIPAAEEYATAKAEVNGEETAVASDETEEVFYATQNGTYFHLDAHCMGMMNALPCSANAVWTMKKQPCPVCVGEIAEPTVTYWATPMGQYYHVAEHCMGMRNASPCTRESAEAAGKSPCPVCLPEEPVFCWAKPGGQYYHRDQHCMGMIAARVYSQVYAEYKGWRPCPECWE